MVSINEFLFYLSISNRYRVMTEDDRGFRGLQMNGIYRNDMG